MVPQTHSCFLKFDYFWDMIHVLIMFSPVLFLFCFPIFSIITHLFPGTSNTVSGLGVCSQNANQGWCHIEYSNDRGFLRHLNNCRMLNLVRTIFSPSKQSQSAVQTNFFLLKVLADCVFGVFLCIFCLWWNPIVSPTSDIFKPTHFSFTFCATLCIPSPEQALPLVF